MIDYIKNGVTTGGQATVPGEPSQGPNIYREYMEQLYKDRAEAMNKNYELLKDVDLSKVDPRDRGAVQGMYDQWKQLALSPPQTSNRRDIIAWRQRVMQGETDVKNRIGEVMSGRQKLTDIFNQNKDKLSANGLKKYNDAFNQSVMDPETGQVKFYNANDFEHAPEKLYDTNNQFDALLKRHTENKVQLGTYKDKNGRVVQTFARAVPINQYTNEALDEYNSNPEFKYSMDRQYQDFVAKNPDSKLSPEDFVKQAAMSRLPQQFIHDKSTLKNIHDLTPGIHYYDTDLQLHNDPRIRITNGPSFADKQALNMANYHAIMNQVQSAVKSGDQAQMDRAGRLLAPIVYGKSFDGSGKENTVQFIKNPDGTVGMKATGPNEWGLPVDKPLNMSAPASWQTLHDSYNNQFHTPAMLPYRIGQEQLTPYTNGLGDQPQQDNRPKPSKMGGSNDQGQYGQGPNDGGQGIPFVNPTQQLGNPSYDLNSIAQPAPAEPQPKQSKVKAIINKGLNLFAPKDNASR